ncbi:hypothetical protein KM043_003071 [Ampulex compressa]|nr:hypothetical protein KM043_003071 [Ampulex compressa]
MEQLQYLRQYLGDDIQVSDVSLSYIDQLFPELHDRYLILHKPANTSTDAQNNSLTKSLMSDYDITGSPLKYSFNDDRFDATLLMKKQWRNEERFLPLTKREARTSLNLCLEYLCDNSRPIFVLCDGNDEGGSRLLGTVVNNNWFTTIEVTSLGVKSVAVTRDTSALVQQHLRLSQVLEHHVRVSVLSVYDLFGIKAEMFDWSENEKCMFEGSLSIEIENNTLAHNVFAEATKKDLVVEIVTGNDLSPLKELWKQLVLLNQYLTMLEQHRESLKSQYNTILRFPDNFTSPYKEENEKVMEDVKRLLYGDYSFRHNSFKNLSETEMINGENAERDVTLEQHAQNLYFRDNLDFTEVLWELLIKNTDYNQMIKCIHTVLQEIQSTGCVTQENFTTNTRFGNVIFNLHNQTTFSKNLMGSLPLEFLIDMGVEKLSRDYIYILIKSGLMQMHEVQERFGKFASKDPDIHGYRRKLLYLARLHICLEFVIIVQATLACPTESLSAVFSFAFKQFVHEGLNFDDSQDVLKSTIYHLRAPLPNAIINLLNEETPATRRISLSSESNWLRLTSTTYYSRIPIFPPSTNTTGEHENVLYDEITDFHDQSITDEVYHTVAAVSWSRRVR